MPDLQHVAWIAGIALLVTLAVDAVRAQPAAAPSTTEAADPAIVF